MYVAIWGFPCSTMPIYGAAEYTIRYWNQRIFNLGYLKLKGFEYVSWQVKCSVADPIITPFFREISSPPLPSLLL